MDINFDQVRAAATDDLAAKLLRERWQLDDRHSATGAVVCDESDIRRMLADGQLENVLTVEQYVSVSRGKAYGAAPMPSQVRIPAVSHGQPAADAHDWEGHPDWQEYQSLNDPMKTAVRHDFRCFLFVKRRGGLGSLAQTVGQQLESAHAATAEADERAAVASAVDNAPLLEAERFEAALRWAEKKPNYPGLQKKGAVR